MDIIEGDYKYNRIIIVGNGLDLSMGLKTSYSNFLLDYFKERIEAARLQKGITNDKLLSTRNTRHSYREKDDYNDIKRFSELISRNPHWEVEFHGILKEIMQNPSDMNWVDIEALYFDSLMPMVDKAKVDKNFSKIERFNDSFRELKYKLDRYIHKVNHENYTDTICITYYGFILDCLNKQKVERICLNHGVDFKELRNPEEVMFLNFNYTNSIYKLFVGNGLKENHLTINIHGRAGSADNSIIFGYGDDTHPYYSIIEQERSDIPLEFIKSFYYSRTDDYHKMLGFMESDLYEVYIVGHSCGLSDRTLLKSIFEHQNCISIKIYHRGDIDEHTSKNMAISRHFGNKQLLRKRVLPFDEFAIIPQVK